LERRAYAIAAVQNHVSNINMNRPPIQDSSVVPTRPRVIPVPVPMLVDVEQQRLNAAERIEILLVAVRNHVLNINVNHAPNVDPIVELIDPVEMRFNETQARDKVKADLILAGTDIMPDTLLIDQIAMKKTMNNLISKINTTKFETCKYCCE
jgi:hypothetical protein